MQLLCVFFFLFTKEEFHEDVEKRIRKNGEDNSFSSKWKKERKPRDNREHIFAIMS